MTDDFDVRRELAAGMTDPARALRFVRGFAGHWLAPLRDGDGYGEADLAAAEERLGRALPAVLRDAYRLFGRRPDLTSNHDRLLAPAELHVDSRGEALVFRYENQGAASWGILLTDLHKADPPVVVKPDLADTAAERWTAWLDRLSWACVEIVLSESLHEPDDLCDFRDDLDETDFEAISGRFTPLPFPAYPPDGDLGARWYAGPDVILREDDRTCLWARARTGEALDWVRDDLPGDWLNDPR
ncbi:SMI1/KNR4 family protein [Streptomyces sp. NPDC026673]|uniref:SMI1/KNR4 family protein n=1 Tax=Streptomyces sp. NPDC026673 TaxID=3155724 RepID=UPI0033EF6D02